MRVLVTGGAGYIGSVICDQLVDHGHTVVVYDNLSKGHADAVSPKATLVAADLLDQRTLRRTIDAYRVEAVVHMAASSLVGESMTDPGRYYRNNMTAGLHLLEAMADAKVASLVFSSTAAVYGEPERQPIVESDPVQPSNTYGETKLALERAFPWFARAHGLHFVSLRYFNAAGATSARGERHDPETHLIPLVLRAARQPQSPVTVFGDDYPTRDGTCVRDYIHVSDLGRAHVLALEALAGERLRAETFNLGCGEGYTVREVIDAASRVTNRDIPVKIGARRAGDPAVLVASSDRIAKHLGWAPRESDIDTIVRSAWEWERTFSDGDDANQDINSVTRRGAEAR